MPHLGTRVRLCDELSRVRLVGDAFLEDFRKRVVWLSNASIDLSGLCRGGLRYREWLVDLVSRVHGGEKSFILTRPLARIPTNTRFLYAST